MNKYAHQIQGMLPGFEVKKYCLEKALEHIECRLSEDDDIARIDLVALVVDINDGNGTEISIRARNDILHYFQRCFLPLEQGAKIRYLRFRICLKGGVTRTATLYTDRLVAAPDDFTALFDQYLIAGGVAYAGNPD